MIKKEDKGLRYNNGKLRYDLLEPFALQELVRVFTKGAEKYEDNNWLKGMQWNKVLASLKRHIAAFEQGEDFDPELGTYHMANAAWNCMALLSYYKHYPQGDNRLHNQLEKPRIGLDIDEVIADWLGLWCEYHQEDKPEFWNFDRDIKAKFESLKDNKDFWLSIKPRISPEELSFEPVAYITSRNIPSEWTEEWLKLNRFPAVPVYTVGHNQSKVEACINAGIDIFVDDRYENFVELNKAGICCYLMDALHNQRYNVGYKRIYDLKGF